MSTKIKPDNDLFKIDGTQLELGQINFTDSAGVLIIDAPLELQGITGPDLGEGYNYPFIIRHRWLSLQAINVLDIIMDQVDEGPGGDLSLLAGSGGFTTSPGNKGDGGDLVLQAGNGFTGDTSVVGGDVIINGGTSAGTGGNVLLKGGNYGNPDAGPVGDVVIQGMTFPGTDGTSGQVLSTDGAGNLQWVTVTGAGVVGLNDITDVTITSPTNGQVLKYNGSAWINGTDNSGGGGGSSFDQNLNTTDNVTFNAVTVSSTLTVDSLVNSGAGTPTISSGNNLNLEAVGQVTTNAPFVLKNYTVAQLSSVAATAGAIAYITNEAGGAQPAFYDGTNWRRFTDRTIVS